MPNKAHTIRRGQIYHINADPHAEPVGCEIWPDRPGIIVSNALMNARNKGAVEIVFLTLSEIKKQKAGFIEHVIINSAGRQATALCDQIHTVDKSRLGAHIGNLTPDEQKLVDEALLFNLFPNYIKPSNMPVSELEQELARYKEGYERLEACMRSIQQLTAVKAVS